MRRFAINLDRFGEGDEGATGASNNQGTFSYAQANEIAEARAERAKNSALKSYFSQQGMSEEQVTAAIAEYKKKQDEGKPDISGITKQRDDALAELEALKNEKTLQKLGVKGDFMEYVAFTVSKNVTDKKNFEAAAKEFIEANPIYAGSGMHVSTGTSGGGSTGAESKNESINNMIRQAIGRS